MTHVYKKRKTCLGCCMAWELSLGGVGRGAGVGSRTVHTGITVNLFRAAGKVTTQRGGEIALTLGQASGYHPAPAECPLGVTRVWGRLLLSCVSLWGIWKGQVLAEPSPAFLKSRAAWVASTSLY